MIEFDLLSLDEASNLSYAYDLWLFHRSEHLRIQSPANWRILIAKRTKDELVVAHLPVHIEQFHAVSPKKATFGSIQCAASIQPKGLYDFIGFVCTKLGALGVRDLQLTAAPLDLLPQHSLIATFLLNQGFQISKAETGMLLHIGERFETGLNEWERRRIRQAREAGLIVRDLDLQNLRQVFDFISTCRSERDYSLAMEYETLQRTVDTFPDRFFLFGVFDGAEMAAASISIDIGNEVLYDFHSAHPRKYDSLSPLVLLKQRMFDLCRMHSFRILDLGTSAVNGTPNFGLIDFKLGLGGRPTVKFTFRKDL